MTVIDPHAGGFGDGYGQRAHAAFRFHDVPENDEDYIRYATGRDGGSSHGGDGITARVKRLVNYLGAIISVGLMVGLALWGYRLVMRDVSGVPVIQAIAGDSRVAPDNPGGELDGDKGLAVNAVAAGIKVAEVDDVAIAPDSGSLTEEDVAMGAFGVTARPSSDLSETAPDEAVASVVATPDAEAVAMAAKAQDEAVAPLIFADVDGIETDAEGAVSALTDDAPANRSEAIAQAVAEAAMPEVARTPRPLPRPAKLVRVASVQSSVVADTSSTAATVVDAPQKAPAPAPKAAAPTAEAESAKPAAGAMVAQIGAFDSDTIAHSEWERVAGKNGNLFAGKDRIVQKTERGGRTFWRLRVAGFGSRDEARDFCAALKASGTDCIPTSVN